MKKTAFIATVMVVVLISNLAQASNSIIKNGSFEDDDGPVYDITVESPNEWDVNFPVDEYDDPKFGGWVDRDWPTDGSYNLTLYSYPMVYDVNDKIIVFQEVCLSDVNEISFDIRLDTLDSQNPWDPNKCTAFLQIDDEVVWESNSVGDNVKGEYRDQFVNIDINDLCLHQLSLGIRINVEEELGVWHIADWDFIRPDFYCGGFGFLDGDFNRDCCVDINDLEMFTKVWLNEVCICSQYNLSRSDDLELYGIINFLDFAIFADNWLSSGF